MDLTQTFTHKLIFTSLRTLRRAHINIIYAYYSLTDYNKTPGFVYFFFFFDPDVRVIIMPTKRNGLNENDLKAFIEILENDFPKLFLY